MLENIFFSLCWIFFILIMLACCILVVVAIGVGTIHLVEELVKKDGV
jgi:hypothetical protein